MKKVKSLQFNTLIIILILLVSCLGLNMTSSYAFAESAESITLNSKKTVQLTAGQVKDFTITISSGVYYVVETRGDKDTYLSVLGLNGGTLTNDDGGLGYNACIGFIGESVTITIRLRYYNSNDNGYTELQIRKQQAVLYGFDYPTKPDGKGDINTIPDLDKPYNYLNGKYETYKFTNNTSHTGSHIRAKDEHGYTRMNSEIVFFSGHGYGEKNGSQGSGVSFPTGSLYVTQLNNMENVKIAVWAACYSSNTNNTYNKSMSQGSVDAGAKASIGWPDVTTTISSKIFTDRFFKKLSEGENVGSAAKYAKNGIIWVWDNVRDYSIAGSSNVTIVASSVQKNAAINSNAIKDYQNRISSSEDWYYHNNNDGSYRVYKTINGSLTNDFYDITLDDNLAIQNISHSGYSLNAQSILASNYLSMPVLPYIIVNDTVFDNLVDIETYNVYYIYDSVAVPIEIKYCTYENSNGTTYLDVVCTNLNNNSRVDYSSINGVEL